MLTVKPREITLEIRDVDKRSHKKMQKINNTLKEIKDLVQDRLKTIDNWDETLRVQSVFLCKKCSKVKATNVHVQSNKHLRLVVCDHLKSADIQLGE